MVGMAEMGALISLDGVAVHPDCWCVCVCYLRFAPENLEDGEMHLLVPAHPGCPRQSPESCKMVVCIAFTNRVSIPHTRHLTPNQYRFQRFQQNLVSQLLR